MTTRPRRTTNLLNREVRSIRESLAGGGNVNELASRYLVSEAVIKSLWRGKTYLSAPGPLLRPVALEGMPLKARRRLFAKLYRQGMSSREIGERHGCDHKTVLRNLHAYGADVREPGGSGRRSHVWEIPEEDFAARYRSTPLKQLAAELGCALRVIEKIASARELYKFTWGDGRHEH